MAQNIPLSNDEDTLQKIEDLIVGSGAADFRKLEQMVDVFCPFEATGMVRQEIKHSKFLAYILDPNRPHVFGDYFLEEFLALILEKNTHNSQNFSRIDLHFMDLHQACIRTEWRNIDLLVELPSNNPDKKGFVVAIELKIDARESKEQLQKYKTTIDKEYPSEHWERGFVFLTKDGHDTREENQEDWIAVSLDEVITKFKAVQKSYEFSGQSNDLFTAYTKMLRRHILENTKLENLAKQLWNKHSEALNILMDHKPNLRTDILDILFRTNDLAQQLSFGDYQLTHVKSPKSYSRFTVNKWDKFPELLTGVHNSIDCSTLLAIQLHNHSRGEGFFQISYLIGQGDAEQRERIFHCIRDSKDIGLKSRKKLSPVYHTLHSKELFNAQKNKSEYNAEDIAQKIIDGARDFLEKTLPLYDAAIQKEFGLKPSKNQQQKKKTHTLVQLHQTLSKQAVS